MEGWWISLSIDVPSFLGDRALCLINRNGPHYVNPNRIVATLK